MNKKYLNFLLIGLCSITTFGCNENNSSNASSSNQITSTPNEDKYASTSFNPWGDGDLVVPSSSTSTNEDIGSDIVHGEFNGTVKIHYFKADLNYDNWDLWLWPYGGGDGGSFKFDGEEQIYDKTWKTRTLDVTKPIEDICGNWTGCSDASKITTVDFGGLKQTKIGIIPRRALTGKEPQKDGDDRFIDLSQTDENGTVNVYVIYNNKSLYYDVKQVEELVSNKIDIVTAVNTNEIHIQGLDLLPTNSESYKVFNGDEEINVQKLTISNDPKKGNILLNKDLDFTKEIRIKVTDLGNSVVTLDGIYDSKYFIDNFTTTEELGPIYTKEYTNFKLWSPYATSVTLNLYEYGDSTGIDSEGNYIHPADPTPYTTRQLSRGEKGVWSYKHNTDCDGIYYTYTISINGYSFENVMDPYAPTSGVNCERGMVIDMDKYNPEGWKNIEAPAIQSANEPIVYELHTRDLTSHETWQGKNNSENRGKYLGLIEEGTRYTNEYGQTTKTGFDYIKDLGVTHVQLLPLNDINSVDEMKLKNEEYNNEISGGSYSWGYDPKHYSSIEGAYSSDPFNGEVKVRELKQVAKKYNEAGIGLILDVVYNHMSNTSTFNMIVPGYYFRTENYGQIVTNYSGAGSDVATEREMMKNFICQNLTTMTKEYKFAGYRFDLMGLIAKDTMQAALEAVQEIDPDTVLYGEAWKMDDNWDGVWNGNKLAVQDNLNTMESKSSTGFQGVVGAFNDGFRTSVKGEDYIGDRGRGWIYGNGNSYEGLKWAVTGAVSNKYNSSSVSAVSVYNDVSAGASINYVECHDGSTLADKISVTVGGSLSNRQKYTELATSLVMFSQGVSFIHAGQEMLRSKKVPTEWLNDPAIKADLNTDHYQSGYFTNSYNYSDAVNGINWNWAITNSKTVSSVRDMIELKKDHRAFFSQSNGTNIINNVVFKGTGNNTLLAYEITPDSSKTITESWSKVLVLQNSANSTASYNLTGEWYNGYSNGIYTTNPQIISSSVEVPAKGTVILFQY